MTDWSALSGAVAYLSPGDKVVLHWLEIKVTADDGTHSVHEQCQELSQLDADAEQKLIQEFPKPEFQTIQPKSKKAADDGAHSHGHGHHAHAHPPPPPTAAE